MDRGRRIYQFRPDFKDRDLDILTERKIYCGKISNQNDPFEAVALNLLNNNTIEQQKFLNTGIASFCRSLTNPLLWSHYANNHFGFVISFDKEHELFIGEPTNGNILFDVIYEDTLPSIDFFPNVVEFRLAAVRTKPTCWAYEQEMRIFFSPGDQKLSIPEAAYKEIIFGARMEYKRKQEIITRVKTSNLNVKFGEMNYLQQGYGVFLKWI